MSHRDAPRRRRNFFAVAALVLVSTVIAASLVIAGRTSDHRSEAFSSVVIRGGGFVTGLAVEGDSMYARTDVGGAYRFDTEQQRWIQMVTASSVSADRRASDYQVEALGAAPSDPSTVYMLTGASSQESPGSRVMRSKNGGRSWSVFQTPWYVGGNDEWRQSGARIAIDPSDPQVLFIGTRRDGIHMSTDGGETWTSANKVRVEDPASELFSIGVTSIIIDPRSPVVDGRHSSIWAGVAGAGLIRSKDGGKSWALVKAFPSGFVSDMSLTSDGALFACFYDARVDGISSIDRVDSTGKVDDISPLRGGRWLTIAQDPNNPGTLLVAPDSVIKGAGMVVTRNGDAPKPEWTPLESRLVDGTDGTNWPTRSNVFDYLSTGQIRFFDGYFWYAEGVGVWRTNASLGDPANWQFASDGIEEFVGNAVLKPARSALLTAQWDRGLMRHPDPLNEQPRAGQQAEFPYVNHFGSAWDIAGSPTDERFIAAVLDDHQDVTGRASPERRASGFSVDGGATWNRFGALASGTAPNDLLFGNIAVSSGDNANLVWIPSNLAGLETKIYFSRDMGASWVSGQMHGLLPDQYLHPRYVQARKILVADPKERGHFYALGSDTAGAAILWESKDGGANWDISWTAPNGEDGGTGFAYDSTLVVADDNLIATPGGSGGCLFRRIKGEPWQEVCSIRGAMGLGLGAPDPRGSGSTVLYTFGTVDGVTGIYLSTDYADTWRLLSENPGGSYVGIRALAGDPEVSGRVYVALAGGGFLLGQAE